jgi:hypothetical protein
VAGVLGVAGGIGCDAAPTAHASPAEVIRQVGGARAQTQRAADERLDERSEGEPARNERRDEAPSEPERLVLRRPPPREPFERARDHGPLPRAGSRTALAFQYDATIFRRPSPSRRPAGLVRRNTRLAVEDWVEGEGCHQSWYALVGGGFVCGGDGFSVGSDPAELDEALQVVPPDAAEPLPYRYAKLRTPAVIYWRLPTAGELATSAEEPVRERAKGAWFVAIDRRQAVSDEGMSRTVRGFWVRDRDLDERPAATMQGELLAGGDALPLAFVLEDQTVLEEPETGEALGVAERFARFTVADERAREGGGAIVVATDGFAVEAEHVRVARARPRPAEVGEGEQWLHVDLDQQVLVAYEGDRPVLATLVSSGKAGFEPPVGLYRVHKKYATATMSGPDPEAGTYVVEDVPWTMYYWGSYALHGAYWHDEFGRVRSHGCTNVPPIDAHWLFHWSAPGLRDGWHATLGIRGPWVWFSRGGGGSEQRRLPSPA